MSGPLCDATLGALGSHRILEDLESRNLLIVLLDHRRESYRYHQLFRELLLELDRQEPGRRPRPAPARQAWCGRPTVSPRWLSATSRPPAATSTMRPGWCLELAQPVWASGRVSTVRRWMDWLEERRVVSTTPRSPSTVP